MSARNQAIPLQSPAPEHPSYQLPEGLGRAAWPAMGTTIALLAPQERLADAERLTRSLFATWEEALSRFSPDSELTQVNQRAGQAVPVSELLWRVLLTALEAARASDGLYDPTLGTSMLRIGYDRTFVEIDGKSLVTGKGLPTPGGAWHHIVLDPVAHSVLLPAGASLDFGGIAKGMAVDAAVAQLAWQGISPVLVNAGGDLAVGGAPQPGFWPVALPGREPPATIALSGGALATSGVGQRRWRQGERYRHHLIDPRTGEPVENDVWSVTVAARRCAQAEVAAKVALLLGEQEGGAFLRCRGIVGRFVSRDGRVSAGAGWPREETRA